MSGYLPAPLPFNATIGIVGGGQLGRMSAMSAARLGYRTHVLANSANDPAVQVSHGVTIGSFDDPDVLREFASHADVITFEFENVSADGLDLLASLKPVHPSGNILRISQDRIAEKSFLTSINVPVAPWRAVNVREDLDQLEQELGFPLILKTTRLGYDGKGQQRITSADQLEAAFETLKPHPLVAEGMISFDREISVMVVRGLDGTTRCFDPAENRHKNGILDLSLAPAAIDPALIAEAQKLAMRIAEALDLIGIAGVEMFVDRNGKLLVNEIAPRPHNSGHWTMDACPIDQFEAHIRAVTGNPLPPLTRHSDAAMKNLIGPDDMALWPKIMATPGLIPHHYGKEKALPGRKMGHVNVLFPVGGRPGEFGLQDALGVLADHSTKVE